MAPSGAGGEADVGDVRESPALKLLDLLRAGGAELSYTDPYVPELPEYGLRSVELSDGLAGCDCAVIVTAHSSVDYDQVAEEAPVVVDFRNELGRTRPRRVPADGAYASV